jgi:hypothetical protein
MAWRERLVEDTERMAAPPTRFSHQRRSSRWTALGRRLCRGGALS